MTWVSSVWYLCAHNFHREPPQTELGSMTQQCRYTSQRKTAVKPLDEPIRRRGRLEVGSKNVHQFICPLSASFSFLMSVIVSPHTCRPAWFCLLSVFTASPSLGWCPLRRWRWSWCRWQWLSQRRRRATLRWWWWWWAGPESQGLRSPICFSSSGRLLMSVNTGVSEWWELKEGCRAPYWEKTRHCLS